MKSATSKALAAIKVAADTASKLRTGDAWRVCDEAMKMGVLAEVSAILERENSSAHVAFCEYRDEEYGGILNFANSHKSIS